MVVDKQSFTVTRGQEVYELPTKEFQLLYLLLSYPGKIFTKENGSLKKKLGTPDLLILFVSTVSHKMVLSAAQEAKRNSVPVARVMTSSATALRAALLEHSAAV